MHESEKWKWSRSVVSNTVWPHGLQPTRLLRPLDFPGKSTGVGCHCLLHWGIVAAAKSLQSCPTLCDPRNDSPPGSAVPGILQARTLEWVAISFSNAWKWKVKVKSLSCARLLVTPWTAAYQAPSSMGFSRQEYWSGLPLPSPGDLPNPGIKPRSPAFQAGALTSKPWGKLFTKSSVPWGWRKWHFNCLFSCTKTFATNSSILSKR